jgi:hypothetical protein
MKSKMHSVEARYYFQASRKEYERRKKVIALGVICFYILFIAFVAGAAIISGGKP